jgi:hypothetical protein
MVWTGGALKVKGKVVDSVCSQNDLVATLLAQLRMRNPAYQWSKNIFQQNYQPSAYYVFNDGFGGSLQKEILPLTIKVKTLSKPQEKSIQTL